MAKTLRRKRTNQKPEPPRVKLIVSLPIATAQGILAIADMEEWSGSKVLASIVADWFKEAGREPLIKHLLATLALNRALNRDAIKVDRPETRPQETRLHGNTGRKLTDEQRANIRRGIRRAKRAKAAAAAQA